MDKKDEEVITKLWHQHLNVTRWLVEQVKEQSVKIIQLELKLKDHELLKHDI